MRYFATPQKVPVEDGVAYEFLQELSKIRNRLGYTAHNDVLAHFIHRLHGDGILAVELAGNWIIHPYESVLRWAVTKSIGRDVEQELAKVQERADRLFESYVKHRLAGRDAPYYKSEFLAKEKRAHTISKKKMDRSAEFAQTDEVQETLAALVGLTQAVERYQEERKYRGDYPGTRLYRGVAGAQARHLLDRAGRSKDIPIAFDHAVSFTDSQSFAIGFAEGTTTRGLDPIEQGIVLSIQAPISSMVVSHEVFREYESEKEYIIATHGSLSVHVDELQRVDWRK